MDREEKVLVGFLVLVVAICVGVIIFAAATDNRPHPQGQDDDTTLVPIFMPDGSMMLLPM